jgi:hypothetical protein
MATLKFQAPDSNAPGFLKRIRKALYFQQAIQNGQMTADIIDGMVDFLADFVIEQKTKARLKTSYGKPVKKNLTQCSHH